MQDCTPPSLGYDRAKGAAAVEAAQSGERGVMDVLPGPAAAVYNLSFLPELYVGRYWEVVQR